jgi:hypothetical protein
MELHNEELHIYTHSQISLGRSNQREWDGQGMWHA